MIVILKKVNMDNYYLVSVVKGTSQERAGCGLLVECLLKAMISIPSFLKKIKIQIYIKHVSTYD